MQHTVSSMRYDMVNVGRPHFNTDKKRPYREIMLTAHAMTLHPQPIKCLESVMLALHLTNKPIFNTLDRVPLGFKTTDKTTGHDYRYVDIPFRNESIP